MPFCSLGPEHCSEGSPQSSARLQGKIRTQTKHIISLFAEIGLRGRQHFRWQCAFIVPPPTFTSGKPSTPVSRLSSTLVKNIFFVEKAKKRKRISKPQTHPSYPKSSSQVRFHTPAPVWSRCVSVRKMKLVLDNGILLAKFFTSSSASFTTEFLWVCFDAAQVWAMINFTRLLNKSKIASVDWLNNCVCERLVLGSCDWNGEIYSPPLSSFSISCFL